MEIAGPQFACHAPHAAGGDDGLTSYVLLGVASGKLSSVQITQITMGKTVDVSANRSEGRSFLDRSPTVFTAPCCVAARAAAAARYNW
jgi:hypothetical protein